MNDLKRKGTILFVDDEQVVLDVGTLMLDRLGYNVLQATDGMEARQIFTDHTDDICLVILDMLLPDENGSDICKRLKQIKPDLKVLHTSGLIPKELLDSCRLLKDCPINPNERPLK